MRMARQVRALFALFALLIFADPTLLQGQTASGPAGLPAPATSSEVLDREVRRREETSLRLKELLDLGDRLYASGEWDLAESKFQSVLAETNPQSVTSGYHRRAQVGKAKCLAAKALAKQEQGELAEAAGLIRQAADLDPENKALARKAKELEEDGAREANPYPGNQAATDQLVEKVAEIKKLLSLADQLTETGQYLEARKKLDDVLRMDPYNRAARKKIELLEEKRMSSADLRYRASREKALAKVSEAWSPPPPAKIDPSKGRQTGSAESSGAAILIKKLAEIRIPEVAFNEKPIREAVEELRRLSEQYDPEKKGMNFVLRLPPAGTGSDPESATISLELRDIPLQTALKYLCEQVRGGGDLKLRAEVEDSAVFLLPATETGGALETRSYNLPSSLISNLAEASDDPKLLGEEILKNNGVKTDVEGASAICFRKTGKIVVRNTSGELNKLEQRIRDAQGDKGPRQFEVETKFLQFSDNDVKNFTFNISMQMNQNNLIPGAGSYSPGIPGAPFVPGSTGGTDGLRGPIGKDLVAAPRVTLADGKESKIVVSREMFYPTSYTQPTVPNNDQGVGAGFILPSNPTGFESRNIGVTLNVKAQSTSIPRAVDLDFTKLQVEDFEGFVDYGALISSVSIGDSPYISGTLTTVNPTQTLIGSAPFLVPIFSKRSLQSRVRLLDGETVGLGGLISESVQMVDDKVPGLGDMPVVGRLFRSEASQKIKFNLVIFCTVRIIEPDGKLTFPDDESNPEYAQAGSAEMMPSVP